MNSESYGLLTNLTEPKIFRNPENIKSYWTAGPSKHKISRNPTNRKSYGLQIWQDRKYSEILRISNPIGLRDRQNRKYLGILKNSNPIGLRDPSKHQISRNRTSGGSMDHKSDRIGGKHEKIWIGRWTCTRTQDAARIRSSAAKSHDFQNQKSDGNPWIMRSVERDK
jgi:hypothetical protein